MRSPTSHVVVLTLSVLLYASVARSEEVARTDAPALRPKKGLLIAGAVTFGLGFVPAVVMGEESLRFGYPAGALMLVPVVGPWATAAIESGKHSHSLLVTTLIADGVLQTTGAVLLFLAFRGASAEQPAATSSLLIGPGPGRAPLGLTLTWVAQ